jgi:hypothetical protein
MILQCGKRIPIEIAPPPPSNEYLLKVAIVTISPSRKSIPFIEV